MLLFLGFGRFGLRREEFAGFRVHVWLKGFDTCSVQIAEMIVLRRVQRSSEVRLWAFLGGLRV